MQTRKGSNARGKPDPGKERTARRHWEIVHPNEEQIVPASDLGDTTTNRFLNIANEDPGAVASYEVVFE